MAHHLLDRVQARRERHLRRSRVYRVAVASGAFVLVAIGIVGVLLPVIPGFPLLLPGLALLALEFAWAERLLVRAVNGAGRARSAFRRQRAG